MFFNLNITDLGFTLLILNYVPAIMLMKWLLRGNVPERLPADSYAKLIVGKVVFGILLSVFAGGPGVGLLAPLVQTAASLGGGYFMYSTVADLFFIAVLYRGEFYGSAKVVMGNLIYLPFVTLAAAAYAVRVEQWSTVKRVAEDLPVRKDGSPLGLAKSLIRFINKPVRIREEADVKPHYDIRPLPVGVRAYYSPVIGEKDFNPHAIVAGSSGSGKTTTVYHLIKDLSRNYPVVFIDVKGDVSRALLSEKANAHVVPVAVVGLNPFVRVGDETGNEVVERLMDSISVVEQVGSRQEHFIREAVFEFRRKDGSEKGELLSYPEIVNFLKGLIKTLPSPERKWELGGTGTRDALYSIYAKLEDLGRYLRDDGASVPEVVGRAVKPNGDGGQGFPVVVFNLEGISERTRAIVLELILRIIAGYVYHRGPLAYLKEKPLVLVVDEAYLVTRPMLRGRTGTSRSVLETIARAGRSYGVALILVTQRLSDIADGIRQNCQTWVVFNTTSPEDSDILGNLGRIISAVVQNLPKGHAYIRVPNERRLDSIRYTRDTIAVTEGYIFEMERELLRIEANGKEGEPPSYNFGTVCYRCMVLSWDGRCPVCKKTPLSVKPAPLEKKQTASGTTSGNGGPSPPAQAAGRSVDWEDVVRRAVEACPEAGDVLNRLTREQIADFLIKYPHVEGRLYVKLGLLRGGGEKTRPTKVAAHLLKVYREVVGK